MFAAKDGFGVEAGFAGDIEERYAEVGCRWRRGDWGCGFLRGTGKLFPGGGPRISQDIFEREYERGTA